MPSADGQSRRGLPRRSFRRPKPKSRRAGNRHTALARRGSAARNGHKAPRADRNCSACAIATARSFPIAYAPGRDQDTLADFCKASCPNTDASVYSRVPGAEIQTAVGLDGKPYMSLPAALKYQKTLDPACSCRATGALMGNDACRRGSHAESQQKGRDRRDAGEVRRNGAPNAPGQAMSKKPRKPAADTDEMDDNGDDMTDRDAAAAAQVPTASTDFGGHFRRRRQQSDVLSARCRRDDRGHRRRWGQAACPDSRASAFPPAQ